LTGYGEVGFSFLGFGFEAVDGVGDEELVESVSECCGESAFAVWVEEGNESVFLSAQADFVGGSRNVYDVVAWNIGVAVHAKGFSGRLKDQVEFPAGGLESFDVVEAKIQRCHVAHWGVPP